MNPKRTLLIRMSLAVLAFALGCAPIAWSQTAATPQTPLLADGKRSLYQRVLTRPNARIYAEPLADVHGDEAPPFHLYYVFQRYQVGDAQWVLAGKSLRSTHRVWFRAEDLLDWRQALTVSFLEPLNRDRTLLFRDKAAVHTVLKGGMARYRQVYEQAEAGVIEDTPLVLAMQPPAYIDIRENFYLVPIKHHEDIFVGSERGRLLQIASVPLGRQLAQQQGARGVAQQDDEPIRSAILVDEPALSAPAKPIMTAPAFKAGLVFVTDTTTSMGPYIDRTREAVDTVFDRIDQAGLRDKVSFGLVAYRDSLAAVPGLGYLSKVYASLEAGRSPEGFFSTVRDAAPAEISSRGFIEDAYAGLKTAIEDIDWRGYQARYVVLVTDAGPRDAGDPLAGTGLSADQIRQLAYEKGISIWVLHLKTPSGRRDHQRAERLYRRVSLFPGIGDFYYGVNTGNVKTFGQVLDTLAEQITEQVRAGDAGLAGAVQAPVNEPRVTAAAVTPLSGSAPGAASAQDGRTPSALSAFQRKVETLGNALRMRYLQRLEGVTAPDVFDAWMVDRDFNDPTRQAVDVRVLLNRNQLSDLQAVLKQVLQTAEEGVLAPDTFLDDLKSLAAAISRDPQAVAGSTRGSSAAGANLADLGYMREYIEDLPYRGEVMNLTISDWQEWSAREQLRFLYRLESKINFYQALHDNTDLWVSLDGGPISGDSVYPIVLEQLP